MPRYITEVVKQNSYCSENFFAHYTLYTVAILARGRRVTRPPFHINKKKLIFILPSLSSPNQENIFVFVLLSVKV